jgi:hypothetical protein
MERKYRGCNCDMYDPNCKCYPIDEKPRVTKINGVKLELGRMSRDEKFALAETLAEKVMKAEAELNAVLRSIEDENYIAHDGIPE